MHEAFGPPVKYYYSTSLLGASVEDEAVKYNIGEGLTRFNNMVFTNNNNLGADDSFALKVLVVCPDNVDTIDVAP